MLHDTVMAAVSFVISLFLRYGSRSRISDSFLIPGVITFTAVCFTVFAFFRLYRISWRYASSSDLIKLTKAVTLAILLFLPLMFQINRLEGIPRSGMVINWFVLLVLLGAPRFIYRALKEKNFAFLQSDDDKKIPVLLIGVNQYSEFFLRENSTYLVVGIIDEDRNKIGNLIHNIPVLGNLRRLPRILLKLHGKAKAPRKIIIAPDYLSGLAVKYVLKICDRHGLTMARLPRISEFQDNIGHKIEMQPIVVEDLLGRAQTALDRDVMRRLIENQTILVTGAGGSIGGELVRQICRYNPRKIILYEFSEYNLYQIDKEMAEKFPLIARMEILGDVRDGDYLRKIFSREKPDLIFHAAAIKHVPIAESNPSQAILTNVIGTMNVADAAVVAGIKGVVVISTDKAVNPTNVMGATKRLAENYCQALAADAASGNTKFVIVRFGNVLGSTGSVVPLFQRQIAAGGPVTLTHPDMTRYFMTIREAVELVIMASSLGVTREKNLNGVFVLDMGSSVKIKDLAEQMITLMGKKPDEEIQISYTGIRPGEKLYEELFYPEEAPQKTEYESIMLGKPRQLDYSHIRRDMEELKAIMEKYRDAEALEFLQAQVPEASLYQTPKLAAANS